MVYLQFTYSSRSHRLRLSASCETCERNDNIDGTKVYAQLSCPYQTLQVLVQVLILELKTCLPDFLRRNFAAIQYHAGHLTQNQFHHEIRNGGEPK